MNKPKIQSTVTLTEKEISEILFEHLRRNNIEAGSLTYEFGEGFGPTIDTKRPVLKAAVFGGVYDTTPQTARPGGARTADGSGE